jgi:hypothetical protein
VQRLLGLDLPFVLVQRETETPPTQLAHIGVYC